VRLCEAYMYRVGMMLVQEVEEALRLLWGWKRWQGNLMGLVKE
jgi:hypothetical protein